MIGALLAVALRRGIMPALDRLAPAVVIAGVAGLIAVTILGGHTWWWNRRMQQFGYSLIAVIARRDAGQCHQPAGRQPVAADAVRGMAARVRQIQLLLVPDSPAGHARRPRVRLQPRGVRDAAIAPWIGQVLFYGVATAPAFALAWLSWRLFEAPILRL